MSVLQKLVLASNNPGKLAEFKTLFAPYGIEMLTANEAGFTEDVAETADTFEGNARLKAEATCAATGLPSLADDSGLCVDAMDGGPGVYSARWGDYRKLLDVLADTALADRTAHFMCVLALAVPGKETRFFEGRVDGFIALSARGERGFAYDYVFLPEGEQQTFAEMTPDHKNRLSHRGAALRAFTHYLQNPEE